MNLSDLGEGGIKSIQRGTSSVGVSSTLNITVSAVNMAKAVLIVDKETVIGGPSGSIVGGVISTLTSATNVRIVSSNVSASMQVAWQLVEFK
jgi:hypothetical protein